MVSDKIEETVRDRFWIGSPEPWMPRVRQRAESYRQMAMARLAAGDAADPQTLREILDVQAEYLESEGAQRERATRLRAARVVAGTCAGVNGDPDMRDVRFTVAIVEEAGKAAPAEALMIMLKSSKSILIGDSRQLPPHVSQGLRRALRRPDTITSSDPDRKPRAEQLAAKVKGLGASEQEREAVAEETLFDHLASRLARSPHEQTLRTQYRMVPGIGELVSTVFYGPGALNHARPSDLSDRDERVAAFAGSTQVRMLDVPGRQQHQGPKSKSNIRHQEIVHICNELSELQRHAANVATAA